MADDLDALASRYNSIAVHLTRRLRTSDRESGLGPARMSALSVLVFGGPCTLSRLAEAEGVTAPTMSRIARALEEGGLVRRRVDPGDRRSAILSATPKGKRLMERARQRRVEGLAMRLGELSAADVDALGHAATILEALEQVPDQ